MVRESYDSECTAYGWVTSKDCEDSIYPMPLDYFFDNPHWVVQQFTGLKDKNGKDIYEGDILKPLNAKDGYTFKVEFEIEPDGPDSTGYLFSSFGVEIVGNIFENAPLDTPLQKEEVEEAEDLGLEACQQCGDEAWDGYICHSCGMKII